MFSFSGGAFESTPCFAAGTLVHTQRGSVPIERLAVGDLALSKPESGEGELAYKRVVRTFVHYGKELVQLSYKTSEEPDPYKARYEFLFATREHPFWVVGEGWTAAGLLGPEGRRLPRLQLADGRQVDFDGASEIYTTDKENIGWVAYMGEQGPGTLRDYAHGARFLANQVYYDVEKWAPGEADDDLYVPFKTTVYNMEVEDYHTYFVGECGVWVHDGTSGVGDAL